MSAVADKATKLIALAGSSNVEEARTAAYQACRIIRENKLMVCVAIEKVKAKPTPSGYGKRDSNAPIVHLSSNGMSSVCGVNLNHAVNFYYLGRIPTLRNCCTTCVETALRNQKR